MRRISRPTRPIDSLLSSSSLSRPRIPSSPCRVALTPCCRLLPTAAFSTSPRHNGILDGKKDKRKDQAFIRKWQKRLLGDSEPIGSRVDPYDPSSPIRISAEELGEEQEVVGDSELGEDYEYEPASTWDTVDSEGNKGTLEIIGGELWQRKMQEWHIQERHLNYMTLKDEAERNQAIREWYREAKELKIPIESREEARRWLLAGIAEWSDEDAFAPGDKMTGEGPLYAAFRRAVVEVHMLSQNGYDPSKMAYPSLEDNVAAIDCVRLENTRNGTLRISYTESARREILRDILPAQEDPTKIDWTLAEVDSAQEVDEVPDDALEVVDEAVKMESSGKKAASAAAKPPIKAKPFDFMSNRPVPRTKPAVESPPPAAEVMETPTVVELEPVPSPAAELEASATASSEAVAAMQTAVRDTIERLAAQSITVQKPTDPEPAMTARQERELIEHTKLRDWNIKFAISKRLLQLTGHRMSDPFLGSSSTLGFLFAHLVATTSYPAKPLHEQIANSTPLTALPNVTIHAKRLTPLDKEKPLGRFKVIEYALRERGLPLYGSLDPTEDSVVKRKNPQSLWKDHIGLYKKFMKQAEEAREQIEREEREEEEEEEEWLRDIDERVEEGEIRPGTAEEAEAVAKEIGVKK
ncbi:hypothetical protein BCR34DRAFT_592864 [Clohesyomyces aquaticus]|uniref:Large ribosomal subunit protein mL50 n=1 Tax=Clohesyomyces aquaticus TaxID=1231657 RepID=A0A1Y1YNJ2_9PLEO|nr:hypothetical protein BCR34DRAFT_592864 [Clohesyomyces aquaticus]